MRRTLLVVAVSLCLAGGVHAATITVTGNSDAITIDGQCSLREALTAANTNLPVNECSAGALGLDTIAFSTGATTITVGLVPLPPIVDPIAIDGATLITIDGGNAAIVGLDLVASGNTIRGLTIRRFSTAGIRARSSNNVIAGNTVDANGDGILIDGSVTAATGNRIGGVPATEGNVITESSGAGIHLISASATIIQSNNISRDTGKAAGGEGVLLEQSSNNTIGATTSGGAGGNTIAGGRLTPFDFAPSIRIASGTNNSMLTNAIRHQTLNSGAANAYSNNTIDLGTDGRTPNDHCDGDTGANHLQNAPVILAATEEGPGVTIDGYLDAEPSSTYTIEFFEEPRSFNAYSAPGRYLNHLTVSTDASCRATFHVALPSPGFVHSNGYSATATNAAGETSEMMTANGAFAFFVQKQFTPATVLANAPSHLRLTLSGPFRGGNAGFVDTLPAGLTASNLTTTCVQTTMSTNGTSITVSSFDLLANAFHVPPDCTVEADVVAASPGVYTNVIPAGGVTGGAIDGDPFFYPVTNGTAAIATLTVVAPNPLVAKSFAAPVTTIGTPDRMTITITNPNPAAAITSVAVTDTYPANLKNAATPNASTTCGGTLTAAGGASALTLSGGTIAGGASCTISVDVHSNVAGTFANTIAAGGVTSSAGSNAAPATASVIVQLLAPGVAKSFANPQVANGAPDRLTITLTNPNAAAITGVAFTDNYPANLINATPANASTTCGGTLTAVAGGSSLSLSGGTIPASGSCTVSVDLTSTVAGNYTNTLPAGSVTSANAQSNASAASAGVVIATPMPVMSDRMLLLLAAMLCAIAVLYRH